MQYTVSLPFRGDTDKAFHLAEAALTASGFRFGDRTAGSVEMIGPGMNSTRQSALAGVSRLHILKSHDKLSIEADLGGVAQMSRFVTLFPVSLVLCLGVVLSIVFGVLIGPGLWLAVVAAVVSVNAVLWLVLGPMIARKIRARTESALDTLLANMVVAGESA